MGEQVKEKIVFDLPVPIFPLMEVNAVSSYGGQAL